MCRRLIASPRAFPTAALKRSILSHHTPVEEAGHVARPAGVKKLVLSHFVPSDDPAVGDQMWLEAARVHVRGEVILGKDLLEL
jgi:ribonuclease BN (tRNA processing enzyme)